MGKYLKNSRLYNLFPVPFLIVKVMLFKYASLKDIFTGNIGNFRSYNLIPFATVRGFFDIAQQHGGVLWAFSNIIGNVLIIAPLGFCVPLLWERLRSFKWTVAVAMIFSLTIELSQYIFLWALRMSMTLL